MRCGENNRFKHHWEDDDEENLILWGMLRSTETVAKRKMDSFHQILVLRVTWVRAHFHPCRTSRFWLVQMAAPPSATSPPHTARPPAQLESSRLPLLWQQWVSTKMRTGRFCVWSWWLECGRPSKLSRSSSKALLVLTFTSKPPISCLR